MKRFIRQALEIWPLYVIVICLIVLALLSGCHTVNGIGRDLQSVTEPYMKG